MNVRFSTILISTVVSLGAGWLSLAALTPAASLAQPVPPPGQEQPLFRELNLSPDQARQVQAIRQQYQQRILQTTQALRQSRQTLGELMGGTASDEQLRQQFRDLQAQEQQLAQLRFDSLLAVRAVLTPDQRRQLALNLQRRPLRTPKQNPPNQNR